MSRSDILPGILGNDKLKKVLAKEIANGTLPQVCILAGPAGCGKRTVATKIAQGLFCEENCQHCNGCQMLAKGNHPDFLLIDHVGTVKLEHAREFKDFLVYPPNSAPRKVVVLTQVDRLTDEAANSLLKVLEEPPAWATCILCAADIKAVLPTIVSRARIYSVMPLPTAQVVGRLVADGIAWERAQVLAGYAQGILGKALVLASCEEFWERREQWSQNVLEVLSRRRDPLQVADDWHQHLEEAVEFLVYWFRDMLMLQKAATLSPVNGDMYKRLEKCVALCPEVKTEAVLDWCGGAKQKLAANCNSRLVLDSLLLKLWEG